MTGKEARRQAGKKIAELKRLSDELSGIIKELPIPTPEEFEAMRRGEKPWTEEAHVAAVIRQAHFFLEEARTTIIDHSGRTFQWLVLLRKRGQRPAPPLERSLRYLVAAKADQPIAPSRAEVYFYEPSARWWAVFRMFLEVAMKVCGQLIGHLGAEDWEEPAGDPEESRGKHS